MFKKFKYLDNTQKSFLIIVTLFLSSKLTDYTTPMLTKTEPIVLYTGLGLTVLLLLIQGVALYFGIKILFKLFEDFKSNFKI